MTNTLNFNNLYVFFFQQKNGASNIVATAHMKFASEARLSQYITATGFILQHRFFANFTCLSSLLRHFKPLKNINIGRRH